MLERKIKPISHDVLVNNLKKAILKFVNSQFRDEFIQNVNSFMGRNDNSNFAFVQLYAEMEKWFPNSGKNGVVFSPSTFTYQRLKSIDEFDDALNDLLNQIVPKYGWFVLTRKNKNTWWFAPNYNELVVNVPKILYHVSPNYNAEKILKKGLFPKVGNKHDEFDEYGKRLYKPRIYLTSDLDEAEQLSMAFQGDQIYNAQMRNKTHQNYYYVFQIDTTKLLKGTKFYNDPEMNTGNSMWTYSRIPPNAVSLHPDYIDEYKNYMEEIKNDTY